jgi:hypothetical protein
VPTSTTPSLGRAASAPVETAAPRRRQQCQGFDPTGRSLLRWTSSRRPSGSRVASRNCCSGFAGPAELPLLGEVAYAAGHLDVAIEAWERAHAACVQAGDHVAAAGAAVRVAMHLLFDTTLMAPVRGWLARAEHLLDGQDENHAHAWLAAVRGRTPGGHARASSLAHRLAQRTSRRAGGRGRDRVAREAPRTRPPPGRGDSQEAGLHARRRRVARRVGRAAPHLSGG